MTIATRKPTGKPAWPIMLIAGAEKAGKSYACALASASDLVGRTFWIGVGEDDPDEYGAIPGARFEIVVHDGTYRGILNAVRDAAAEPTVDGKPNLIVLDSGGRVWSLLSDMANVEAYDRAKSKAAKFRKPIPKEDAVRIDMDLWNIAADRWTHIMNELRAHPGPSIITARLDIVTVMDEDGKPTKEKTNKVQAHKSLPFDAGVIIEMRERGETWLTGLRSVAFPLDKPRRMPDFTVDELWRNLGLTVATTERQFSTTTGQQSIEAEDDLATTRGALLGRLRGAVADPVPVAEQWFKDHGHLIKDTTDLDSLTALVVTHEMAKAS